jgi:hypothetical protein
LRHSRYMVGHVRLRPPCVWELRLGCAEHQVRVVVGRQPILRRSLGSAHHPGQGR